jgi:hypothetical protein
MAQSGGTMEGFSPSASETAMFIDQKQKILEIKSFYENLDITLKQDLLLTLQGSHITPSRGQSGATISESNQASPIPNHVLSHRPRSLTRQKQGTRNESKKRRFSETENKSPQSSTVNESGMSNDRRAGGYHPRDQPVILEGINPDLMKNPVALMKKIKAIRKDVQIKEARRTRNNHLLIVPINPLDTNKLLGEWTDTSLGKIRGRLPKNQVILHQVIVTNVDPDVTEEEVKTELDKQDVKVKNAKRIISSKTNTKTTLIRVTLENEEDKRMLLKNGVFLESVHFKCIKPKEDDNPLPKVNQCWNCQEYGDHFSSQCTNVLTLL